MRVILCTGMSGSGKRASLHNLVQMPPPPNHEWMLLDVGDIMFELDQPSLSRLSDDRARSAWEDAVLKRVTSLGYQRSAAHQRILAEILKAQEQENQGGAQKTVIVSTHAMFHYNYSRLKGFEPHWLTDLDPDLFVTIIDDILEVWRRLRASGQQRWTDLTTAKLLNWREEEHLITQTMANLLGKEYLLVPRRRSAGILYDLGLVQKQLRTFHWENIGKNADLILNSYLVFHPDKVPVYLSYPMTFVQHYLEILDSVKKLREELSDWFVLFDPADIRDLECQEKLFEDLHREYAAEGRELSPQEEKQIGHHLKSQTVARDHALIEQCCGIVVYYPALQFEQRDAKGRITVEEIPPFSSGVLDEIFYATQRGKAVYLIWTAKRPPGPFLETLCNVRVRSPEELVNILASRPWQLTRTSWCLSTDLIPTNLEDMRSRLAFSQ